MKSRTCFEDVACNEKWIKSMMRRSLINKKEILWFKAGYTLSQAKDGERETSFVVAPERWSYNTLYSERGSKTRSRDQR